MTKLLWDDVKISSEAEDAREELDGNLYVRHVISQLLVKMRSDYEARIAELEREVVEVGTAWAAEELP